MVDDGQRWPWRPTIVVGVDGSCGSKIALRWALEQADRTAADVEAVNVWTPDATSGAYAPATVSFDLAGAAETVLLDTLVDVTRVYGRSVPIKPRVLRGFPAEELLHAARSAQLRSSAPPHTAPFSDCSEARSVINAYNVRPVRSWSPRLCPRGRRPRRCAGPM